MLRTALHISPASKKGAWRASALTVAVSLTFVLAGCGTSPDSGADEGDGTGSGPQVLRVGLSAEPPAPLAGLQQGAAMNQFLSLVHRGLMTYEAGGELVPALAETVETPDDVTYVFTLHDGLTFQDDTPLTADEVKATLDYYRDPANGSVLLSGLADIADIQSDGALEVTVTLSAPNGAFLQYLALPFAAIVPTTSLSADISSWVGAGPFEVTDFEAGVGATLERNDDYYSNDENTLDTVEFAFYADGEARTNALLSGDVDMIDYVPFENFDRVEDAGFTVDAKPGPYHYVQFNVTSGPFADPKVRQAVAFAIDRDKAVTAAVQGNGGPLAGIPIPEGDAAYDPDTAEIWTYDPEHAKELLAEAGYPDGFSATLLATSQYAFLQDTALSVQEDLVAIGIDVEMDLPDWSTRLTKGNSGDYDIAISGDSGLVTDPSFLINYVGENETFNSSWGYANAKIEDLIEQGLRTSDDEEKHELYQQVTEEWTADVPLAFVSTREQAYAYRDGVAGFETLPGFLSLYSPYTFVDVTVE